MSRARVLRKREKRWCRITNKFWLGIPARRGRRSRFDVPIRRATLDALRASFAATHPNHLFDPPVFRRLKVIVP